MSMCRNILTLKHHDLMLIERAVLVFRNGGVLQTFCPVPQELIDSSSNSRAARETNFTKFGYYSADDFRQAEWGTKTDILCTDTSQGHIIVQAGDLFTITLKFDTQWSPPIEGYAKLAEQGFEIAAMFYDPEAEFCGEYSTADGETLIELEGDSGWARHHVPAHIDRAFSIVANMQRMEAEESAYDDFDLDDASGVRRMRNYED